MNWLPGTAMQILSPVTYLVNVDGRTRFVHANHLKKNLTANNDEEIVLLIANTNVEQMPQSTVCHPSPRTSSVKEIPEISPKLNQPVTEPPEVLRSLPSPRRSQRSRRAPQKLNL